MFVVVRETVSLTEVLFKGPLTDCLEFQNFYLDDESVFVQELA